MNKLLTIYTTTLMLCGLFAVSTANATVYTYDIDLDLNNATTSNYSLRMIYDFADTLTLNTGDTLQFNYDFIGDQRIEVTKSQYDQQRINNHFYDVTTGSSNHVSNYRTSFNFTDVEGDFNEAYRLVKYPHLAGALSAGPFQKNLTDSSFSFGGGEIAIFITDAGTTPITVDAFTFEAGMSRINAIIPVSEPQLIGLLGLGLIGFGGFAVRKRG